jgi:hypothetical protein
LNFSVEEWDALPQWQQEVYYDGLVMEFSAEAGSATAQTREPTYTDEGPTLAGEEPEYSDGYSTTPPPELRDEAVKDELSELADFGITIQRPVHG